MVTFQKKTTSSFKNNKVNGAKWPPGHFQRYSSVPPHAQCFSQGNHRNHPALDGRRLQRWLPACSDGILGSYLLPDMHSPVRTPRYSNVSLSFDVNLTHFFSDGINKDNRPLNARRMGPSLGSGHYSPGFCSSFAWGGKCAQLRDNEDSSLACKTTKD